MSTTDTVEDKVIYILQHRVTYFYRDMPDMTMSESSEEHVKAMIADGYNQGELCDMGDDQESEYRGWWQISN